jgi:hypothetical protein
VVAQNKVHVDKARLGWLLVMVGFLFTGSAMIASGAQAEPKGTAKGWHEQHDTTTTVAAAPTTTAAVAQASDCGAYCPSGVGLPSGNGSGNGSATGKPCAGCVGNADAKNPPGQAHDGSDHNNGYECDGNNGIGKTNPAHSGCHNTTTTVPKTTTTTAHTTTTAAVTTTTAAGPTTTVVPATTTTTAASSVLGLQLTRPADPAAAGLARTGGQISPLVALGLLLSIGGATMIVGARRRATT